MTGKPNRTIGYLRVSTGTQDLKKNRAEILAFANEKDLGRVEFVEETASGRTAWRDRKIATVLDGLGADDTGPSHLNFDNFATVDFETSSLDETSKSRY